MITIITLTLVISAGLVAFSQFFYFSKEAADENTRSRYMILTLSVILSAGLYVGMSLAYGNAGCFVLYAIDKFVRVVIMTEIVLLTKDMVDVNPKTVSVFISVVSYYAAGLMFVDILAPQGGLVYTVFGVYFRPGMPWHEVLYFVFYMFYVVMLSCFVVYRGAGVVRAREKHDMQLLLISYIFGAGGYLVEQFIITYSVTYFPVAIFTNAICAVFIRKLLVYHESILVKASHFSKELAPGRCDVVFVVDSKFNIIFQNKRAEVLACLNHDSYLDRNLTDVFEFSDGAISQLNASLKDESAFGVSAEYEPAGRHVNMIINHKMDRYGEVLVSVVFVYNMEELNRAENHVLEMNEENENVMIESALSITRGARILVVDEDILFLNVFQRLLKPYEVNITRAVGGNDAIEQVSNHIYDIIFIAYEMNKQSGTDTVRRIRSLPGSYPMQVPIVFVTAKDINEVYMEFLDVGFSDYINKPVSKRMLNSVLTRWLWKRFDKEAGDKCEYDSPYSAQYVELRELMIDAVKMFEQHKYEMLRLVLNGVRRNCITLKLDDLSELAADIDEAILLEDYDSIPESFMQLKKGIEEAITV